jgi:hypothetical protein
MDGDILALVLRDIRGEKETVIGATYSRGFADSQCHYSEFKEFADGS